MFWYNLSRNDQAIVLINKIRFQSVKNNVGTWTYFIKMNGSHETIEVFD